ncbi:SphA family protein [Chitinophaga lutea]
MRRITILFVCILALLAYTAQAQLKGTHLTGLNGLKSGSQAPPGFNLLVPAYLYGANKLRDDHGDVRTDDVDLTMFITGIGANWTFAPKILGGHLGGTVLFPFASNRISGNLVDEKNSIAFTDIYFQPLQLGWSSKRADFQVGYALYLPSGRYEKGADDNTGLGMLANEFSAGSTLYFDEQRTLHFSGLFFYEINGKKKDTDIKVGDLLTVEGGLGKTWYRKAAKGEIPVIVNAGIAYYAQFKTSADQVPVDTVVVSLGGRRDRIFGLGPEANIFLPGIRTQLTFRWVAEIAARNRFQGNMFLATIAYNVKSFQKK